MLGWTMDSLAGCSASDRRLPPTGRIGYPQVTTAKILEGNRMATAEQCRRALQQQCKTKSDMIEFRKKWGGAFAGAVGPTDKEWLDANIAKLLDEAHRGGDLDRLGVQLGIPTDAERERQAGKRTNFRSWVAIILSAIALGVSAYVAFLKQSPPT